MSDFIEDPKPRNSTIKMIQFAYDDKGKPEARSTIIFDNGDELKILTHYASMLKLKSKVNYITHDNENIKFFSSSEAMGLDTSIPPGVM